MPIIQQWPEKLGPSCCRTPPGGSMSTAHQLYHTSLKLSDFLHVQLRNSPEEGAWKSPLGISQGCCETHTTSRLFWEFSCSAVGLVPPPLPQGEPRLRTRNSQDGAGRSSKLEAHKQKNKPAEKRINQFCNQQRWKSRKRREETTQGGIWKDLAQIHISSAQRPKGYWCQPKLRGAPATSAHTFRDAQLLCLAQPFNSRIENSVRSILVSCGKSVQVII